jgi:hypothetical protein
MLSTPRLLWNGKKNEKVGGLHLGDRDMGGSINGGTSK